jgi:signal transduction histidine kinase
MTGDTTGANGDEETRAPLGRSEFELGAALSTISHEIRNPLASLKLNAQLIARAIERGKAPRDEAGRLLIQAVDQLDSIAGLLSDAASISSGRLTFSIAPMDMVALARASAAEAEAVWKRAITLDVPDKPVLVLGDAARVRQVIARLLANAVAFTPAGRSITLAVRQRGDRARVETRDAGPGIAPRDLPLIFEPFYRGTDAPQPGVSGRAGQGLGLGLYIARGLIQGQGGEIGAESAPGQGASFWFTLPIAPRN